MRIINNCTSEAIQRAAHALIDGNLVAFPTETVYGLGADASNLSAVSRIYSVKARPKNHPLIVHISSIDQLEKWSINIPEYAKNLAKVYWPGAITIILKRSDLAGNEITGGQSAVGIRVPSNQIALELLKEFEKLGGNGVVAPSANRFGAVSPTTSQAVEFELGDFLGSEDLILNGGQCEIGIESTIIDCTGNNPVVLRPGAVTLEMIRKVIGEKITFGLEIGKTRTSGLLASHYAPKAKVVLSMPSEEGYGFIALADIPDPHGSIRLASPKNIEEYAKSLYQALRLGDDIGVKVIFAVKPDGEGLAMAIRDRLSKAASGR